MGIISEIGHDEIGGIDIGNKGPKIEKTRQAQKAVDAFLESGYDACKVAWADIDPDFDTAKRAIAYRISYTKEHGAEGSGDLSMRSSRDEGEIYLVHIGRVAE